jgi:hypothetical protein
MDRIVLSDHAVELQDVGDHRIYLVIAERFGFIQDSVLRVRQHRSRQWARRKERTQAHKQVRNTLGLRAIVSRNALLIY